MITNKVFMEQGQLTDSQVLYHVYSEIKVLQSTVAQIAKTQKEILARLPSPEDE
jgi:hypothetical protein